MVDHLLLALVRQPRRFDSVLNQSAYVVAGKELTSHQLTELVGQRVVKHFRIVRVHRNEQTAIEIEFRRVLFDRVHNSGPDVRQRAKLNGDLAFGSAEISLL